MNIAIETGHATWKSELQKDIIYVAMKEIEKKESESPSDFLDELIQELDQEALKRNNAKPNERDCFLF